MQLSTLTSVYTWKHPIKKWDLGRQHGGSADGFHTCGSEVPRFNPLYHAEPELSSALKEKE